MSIMTKTSLAGWRAVGVPLLLLASCVAPASAAPCPAALDMNRRLDVLERRTDLLQRREWLLLEYLASDDSPRSRRLLDREVAKLQARAPALAGHARTLASIPANAAQPPQEGTPECATITRATAAIDDSMDLREKELAELTDRTYPFVRACDEIGVGLVEMGVRPRRQGGHGAGALRLSASIALGPQTDRAKMSADVLDRLAGELFAPTSLPSRTLTAFGALRCLRNHQRIAVKPLTDAAPALAECRTISWSMLGQCVVAATTP